MKKALIFDSSSIITLSMNNLLSLLAPLKKKFRGEFYITDGVKKEIVDRPLQIKRFELNAMMISILIKDKVLDLYEDDIREKSEMFLNKANSVYIADGEKLKILHYGESSCIALHEELKRQNYQVSLVVDERTTRMLCENPINLGRLLGSKLHTNVKLFNEEASFFKDINIIRSSELCFAAYKLGLIKLPGKSIEAIDALLYAAKYKGCSISYEEIEKAKRLV